MNCNFALSRLAADDLYVRLMYIAYGDADARSILRMVTSGSDAIVQGYRATARLLPFNGRLFRIGGRTAEHLLDYEIAEDTGR